MNPVLISNGMKNNSIILIGMAGVGKSTSGKLLAEMLEFEFVDVDLLLANQNKKTLQELLDALGDDGFLQMEKQVMDCLELAHRVVAPGGSIIYNRDLMESLKQKAILVYLKDSFENIKKREKERGTGGVIGVKTKTFKEVFAEREPLYEKYADIIINVSDKSPAQVTEEIIG